MYIEQVAIDPEHQNKHLGGIMYKILIRTFPRTDFYAHIAVDNHHSLRFHGHQGFVPIGDYVKGDYHSLLMWRQAYPSRR